MRILGTVAFVVLVASTCFAQDFSITLQDYTLKANALSDIYIPMSGGGMMGGVTLSIQIGDGVTGPAIAGITFLDPGMIFAGNNDGEVITLGSAYGFPGFAQGDVGVHIPPDPDKPTAVAAGGVFCKVTIDMTGFDKGEWVYTVGNTMAGPTQIKDLNGDAVSPAPTFSDGIIIPEPATMALLGFGAMSVLLRKRRAA